MKKFMDKKPLQIWLPMQAHCTVLNNKQLLSLLTGCV